MPGQSYASTFNFRDQVLDAVSNKRSKAYIYLKISWNLLVQLETLVLRHGAETHLGFHLQ